MKVLKMTVLAMVVAVSGMNIYNSQMESKNVDHLTLENVEALAGVIFEENDMNDFSGKPCYNSGKFNSDKPDVLKCGTPCKYEPTDLGMFPTTSYCL